MSLMVRAFGFIFILVALIGFATLFGNYQQYSPSRTAPQLSTSQVKPYANILIPSQAPSLRLLNTYLNPPEIPPEPNPSWINAHIPSNSTPGRSLPADFVFVSGCRPGYRC